MAAPKINPSTRAGAMEMEPGTERVVALIDMDCFYVQVEQKVDPHLRGKPCAVVQYKSWQGGGIIAVSYEARSYGVTRGMRGLEAKKKCPQLQLARIPEAHGKADLSRYREASVQVIAVMSRFAVIERASIDEAYVDLTAAARERVRQMEGQRMDAEMLKTTFVNGFSQPGDTLQSGDQATLREEERRAGVQAWLEYLHLNCDQHSPELQLTAGALIVEEMRAAVKAETGYRCSAGISHNKVLAKLSCGLNKPDRQTLLPLCSVPKLFDTLPIGKIRNLGGKLGEAVARHFNIEYVGQLRAFPLSQLQAEFGDKTGRWLFDLCRGVEFEPVRARHLPKSIGCSKNFLGTEALSSCEQVKHWLLQLATELEERLTKDREQNQRVGKQLSVGVRLEGAGKSSHFSRCCALSQYQAQSIANNAFSLLREFNTAASHQTAWSPAVTGLCLSTGKFTEPLPPSARSISQFLSIDGRCREAGSFISETVCLDKLAQSSAGYQRPRTGSIASYFQRVSMCPDTLLAPGSAPLAPGSAPLAPGSDRSCPVNSSFFRSKAAGATFADTLRVPETQGSFPDDLQTFPPPGSSLSPDLLLQCVRCGEHKAPWEMPEHQDFHFASDLQKSLSAAPSLPASSRPSTSSHPPSSPCPLLKKTATKQLVPGGKRARISSGQTLTLDSYFRKDTS